MTGVLCTIKNNKRIAMTETQSLILFKQRQWRLKENKETVTKV